MLVELPGQVFVSDRTVVNVERYRFSAWLRSSNPVFMLDMRRYAIPEDMRTMTMTSNPMISICAFIGRGPC